MNEMPENPLHKELLEKLTNDTNSIHDSLVVNATKGRIKEDIFASYFLPRFLGIVKIPKDVNIMAEWISVAGTPVAEVDVVDIYGDVLFTVPGLFDSSAINPDAKKERGLREIFAMFDLKMNNLPSAADKFLAVSLEKDLETLTPNEQKKIEQVKRWRDIISRYFPEHLASEEGSGFDTDVSIDDDIEYD